MTAEPITLERVARAICKARGGDPDRVLPMNDAYDDGRPEAAVAQPAWRNHVVAAEAAITAALDSEHSRKEGEWRDMASAPKDGTYILLGYFLEGGGGGEPSIAFWHSTRKLWCGAGGFLNAAGYFSPTHWMPLPLPPIQQGE